LAERSNHRRQMVGEAPTPAQRATPDERAAVEAALVEFASFERTDLLPVLQAVQAHATTLSLGLLGYLGERIRVPFAELYGVASFYALLNTGRPGPRVRLCSGVPCILAGAEQVGDALGQAPGLEWSWFPCIGQCDRAPAALVDDQPIFNLSPSTALDVLESHDRY
jgi:NADH-quinone oxidoreductase subunit F